jgi:CheY-like chemotaxis protein
MVVEDEDAVREITRRILEGKGYRIIEARDAQEALLLCAQRHTELRLLITDVIMPGMSGTELAESLELLYPSLPVLFISGYVDDAARQQIGLQASDAFLAKPFTAEGLARRVRGLLDAGAPVGKRQTSVAAFQSSASREA